MGNKNLIMCGDSFAAGIGCHNLETEPVGSLVSDELKLPLINLAKGSSTNFSIFLQMKYVADKLADQAELVLIGNTSYDRVEWFPLTKDMSTVGDITNEMVNYHQYPPYMEYSYHVKGKNITLPNPMSDDPDYSGEMFTENYMGIIDFWENFGKKKKTSTYYKRFENEPLSRMKTLYEFATTIHEPRINRIYSIAVLALGHQRLKRKGIKHLIFTQEVDAYAEYIDRENLVEISWGQLSVDYPDDLPSWHTSPEGHKIARDKVMSKLKENKWI